MEKQFNCYVDSDYLRTFLNLGNNFSIEDLGNEQEVWRSLFKFYLKKSRIKLKLNNTSVESLNYDLESSLTKYFLNANSQGDPNVYIQVSDSNELKPDELDLKGSSFIFSSDGKSAIDIESNYCIECISELEILKEWELYTSRKSPPILISAKHNSKTQNGWDILNKAKHPCNAMIISDRYLLSNYWNIENDLFPILKIFLPDQPLSLSFDLTIIVEKIYWKRNSTNEEENLFKVYKRIERFIKKTLKCENLNLTIYKLSDEHGKSIHDRHIYTNYFMLYSGFGFGCFDQFGKSKLWSSTTIDAIPITEDSDDTFLYSSFIKEKKEVTEKAIQVVGSKKNRLFENL